MGLIDVIETAYELESDNDSWLDDMCSAVSPFLNYGMGTVAFSYQVDQQGRANALSIKQHGTPFDVSEQVRASHAALPNEWVRTVLMVPGHVGSGLEVMPAAMRPTLSARLTAADAPPDSMGLCVSNIGGQGLVLCAAMLDSRPSTRGERARWLRLLPHVRAGMRLRHFLSDPDPANPALRPVEAIIEPGGKVVHAEGEAKTISVRAALQRRAKAIDSARASMRRSDPDEALRIWRGLVDGTWSLVDRFDSDGRRFVVARRNEPIALDPRGLSAREFQVANLAATGAANKHIAYELGVSTSTVSTLLQRAMKKLGVRNRVELRPLIASIWCAEHERASDD